MISVPPALPLPLYELLARLTGGSGQHARLLLSTTWGRPQTPRRSKESPYWKQYERYRSAASICDPAAIALWRSLARKRPSVIVEFGTGFSTFVMAAFSRHMAATSGRKPSIVTIEHDQDWFRMQKGFLKEAGLSKDVHLVHGPIEQRSYFGREVMCYGEVENTLAASHLEGLTDFVFVDGPPGASQGRSGSTLQALSICKAGGMILIHDALRREEYEIIREFHADQTLPFICQGIIPVWYGLAICRRT